MNCNDIHKYIQPFLDGEFDGPEAGEIEAHIKYCPACKAAAQSASRERDWLRDGLKRACADVAPPLGLEDRVVRAVRATAAEMDFERRRQRASARPFLVSLLRWSPALALVAVLSVAMLSPSSGSTAAAVVEDSALQHARDLPVEVADSDPALVRRWFVGKVDFGVGDLPPRSPDMRLIGARLSRVRDRTAAHFVFSDAQGHRASLMVFEPPAGFSVPSGAEPRIVGGRPVHVAESRGYHVLYWQQGPLVYTLVSDQAPESVFPARTAP